MEQSKNKLKKGIDLYKRAGLKSVLRAGARSVSRATTHKGIKFLYRYNNTACLAKKFLPLQTLQLEVTVKCNLNCIFCNRPYKNLTGEDLGLNDFKTILNKLPDLTSLSPQGLGEPLLNPDIFSMLELAKSKSIKTHVNTNFMIFSEEIAKKLALLVDNLTISMSGASKETYESIHRGASFERVIKNIRKFMEIKKGLGRKNAVVSLKFIIINKNIQEIQRLIVLADTLGIENVCINDLIPFKEINHLKVDKDRVAKEVGLAKKIAKEKEINLISDLRKRPYSIGEYQKRPYSIRECQWPFRGVFIDINGEVYPCCSLGVFFGKAVQREISSFGNIFTDDLNSIWKGKNLEALRKKLAQNQVPEICKKVNCLYVQEINTKESGGK